MAVKLKRSLVVLVLASVSQGASAGRVSADVGEKWLGVKGIVSDWLERGHTEHGTALVGITEAHEKADDRVAFRKSLKAVISVSFLLTFALGMVISMSYSRKRTGTVEDVRKSRVSTALHPLMLRAGAKKPSKHELHPETGLVEDILLAVTPRRAIVFNFCLLICLAIVMFTDEHDFAIKIKVPNVGSKDACEWHCRNAIHSQRGVCSTVKFVEMMCPADTKTNQCLQPGAQQKPGLEYVPTPVCSYEAIPLERNVVIVLCSLIMGIFLIVEGVTAELVFIGMASSFAVLGIITESEAFSGVASGSVVGLAFLFPVASAVEETGVLDLLVGLVLGNPTSLPVALFRMMIPVGFLSAFLSNTALVAMMIPVILSWARRLNVSAGKLMMPLSFAAQIGGCCTLIGSSACMVAKTSVDRTVYDMGFFDLALPGSALSAVTMVFMALFLPLLQSTELTSEPPRAESGEGGETTRNAYMVDFVVVSGGSQVGMQKVDLKMQLERLPGIKAISFDDSDAADAATAQEGTVVHCTCTDKGIIALRRVQGLLIGNIEDLRKMGMGFDRRYRHTYEVVLNEDSALVGQPMEPNSIRQVLGACPIALRGKEPAPSHIEGRETYGAEPAAGDVLLLEADERYVGTAEWAREFSVTRKVENSSPVRVGGVHDHLRCVLVCVGMLLLCTLQAMDVLTVATGAGIFVFLLVLSNAMTMSEVYSMIKGPILLTIAGASALSAALQVTGIASFIAKGLVKAAAPFGTLGLQFAVYFVAAGMSAFMNNAATIAILGPLTGQMSLSTGVSVQHLLFITLFGAGACFTTPLGFQTNLMVMKDGGYSFGSFMKYGMPIQIIHMFATIFILNAFRY